MNFYFPQLLDQGTHQTQLIHMCCFCPLSSKAIFLQSLSPPLFQGGWVSTAQHLEGKVPLIFLKSINPPPRPISITLGCLTDLLRVHWVGLLAVHAEELACSHNLLQSFYLFSHSPDPWMSVSPKTLISLVQFNLHTCKITLPCPVNVTIN